jgi:hypothetical protein
MAKLLLAKERVDVNVADTKMQRLLLWAAINRHKAIAFSLPTMAGSYEYPKDFLAAQMLFLRSPWRLSCHEPKNKATAEETEHNTRVLLLELVTYSRSMTRISAKRV